jgi:hypothetical protein
VNTSDGHLRKLPKMSLPVFVCFPAGTGGESETNRADCRHPQRTVGSAEPSSATDRLRYDVYVRFLHSVHVPEPDIFRVSHGEQPGAPAAG